MISRVLFIFLFALLTAQRTSQLFAAESKPTPQLEWDKTLEAAKKEGKLACQSSRCPT